MKNELQSAKHTVKAPQMAAAIVYSTTLFPGYVNSLNILF